MDCQFSKFPIAFCSCCLIEVYRTLISVFLKFRLSRNKLFIPLCNTADHPTNNCIRNAYFAETVNRTGVGPLGWRAFNSSTAVFTGLASKKKKTQCITMIIIFVIFLFLFSRLNISRTAFATRIRLRRSALLADCCAAAEGTSSRTIQSTGFWVSVVAEYLCTAIIYDRPIVRWLLYENVTFYAHKNPRIYVIHVRAGLCENTNK